MNQSCVIVFHVVYYFVRTTGAVCSSDADCNSPFGWCDSSVNAGVGACTCMFGFTGIQCYNRKFPLFANVNFR